MDEIESKYIIDDVWFCDHRNLFSGEVLCYTVVLFGDGITERVRKKIDEKDSKELAILYAFYQRHSGASKAKSRKIIVESRKNDIDFLYEYFMSKTKTNRDEVRVIFKEKA